MKLLTILGARPQFIKASVVSRVIREHDVQEKIVHTGQHYDTNMSEIFFNEMGISKPDYNLRINCLDHGAMTGRMMEQIERIILKETPDVLMVYGDTNTTLAGALTAKKQHVKVAHVEAGLRSYNMDMPEEINRILTDRISDYLFCPTARSVDNLHKEGYGNFDCKIEKVGDVMYDAALYYSKKSDTVSEIISSLRLTPEKYVLCTVHRQENINDPEKLKSIVDLLNTINKKTKVILPLHPRTKKIIQSYGLKLSFKPIAPVGYLDMIQLMKNSALIITDSGGMQKEACFFRKFCITLRNETEWMELVDHKVNFLARNNKEVALKAFNRCIGTKYPIVKDLYGNGNAAQKITEILEKIQP